MDARATWMMALEGLVVRERSLARARPRPRDRAIDRAPIDDDSIVTSRSCAHAMYAARRMARLASIQRANSLRASASYASTTSKDSIDAFMSKFAKFAPPKFDAPSTPTTFMPAQAQATTTATPEKLTLNFYMPHAAPHDGEQVRIDDERSKSAEGAMGRGRSRAIDRSIDRAKGARDVEREREARERE